MDFESRDRYRGAIGEFAEHSSVSEREVAAATVACRRESASDGSRAGRRTHVGYYLVDKGLAQSKGSIEYRAPSTCFSRLVLRHPASSTWLCGTVDALIGGLLIRGWTRLRRSLPGSVIAAAGHSSGGRVY